MELIQNNSISLSFEAHINYAWSAYFHLCNINLFRPSHTHSSTPIPNSLVTSCVALQLTLLWFATSPLTYPGTWIIPRTPSIEHIDSIFQELHWLPVKQSLWSDLSVPRCPPSSLHSPTISPSLHTPPYCSCPCVNCGVCGDLCSVITHMVYTVHSVPSYM